LTGAARSCYASRRSPQESAHRPSFAGRDAAEGVIPKPLRQKDCGEKDSTLESGRAGFELVRDPPKGHTVHEGGNAFHRQSLR
jgi:hypothetical protein